MIEPDHPFIFVLNTLDKTHTVSFCACAVYSRALLQSYSVRLRCACCLFPRMPHSSNTPNDRDAHVRNHVRSEPYRLRILSPSQYRIRTSASMFCKWSQCRSWDISCRQSSTNSFTVTWRSHLAKISRTWLRRMLFRIPLFFRNALKWASASILEETSHLENGYHYQYSQIFREMQHFLWRFDYPGRNCFTLGGTPYGKSA